MSDEKIEPTLFIGGPADGRRMCVKSNYVEIPVIESIPEISDFCQLTDKLATYTYTTYKRQKIAGENKYFNIMVCNDMSPDEMIAALIDGYKSADRQGD